MPVRAHGPAAGAKSGDASVSDDPWMPSMGPDFLVVPRNATVSGIVVRDADRDGETDTGEGGTAGGTVELTGTGVYETATPGSDGKYSFTGLPPGAYTLVYYPPAGYATPSPTGRVSVVAGETKTVNFYAQSPAVSVSIMNNGSEGGVRGTPMDSLFHAELLGGEEGLTGTS